MLEVRNADVGAAFGEADRLRGPELAAAAGYDGDSIVEGDGGRNDGNVSEFVIR